MEWLRLYGDGPGTDFMRSDDDVHNYLAQFGVVAPTLPVTGRPASRTVWRVPA